MNLDYKDIYICTVALILISIHKKKVHIIQMVHVPLIDRDGSSRSKNTQKSSFYQLE